MQKDESFYFGMKCKECADIEVRRIGHTANEQWRKSDEVVRSKLNLQKDAGFYFEMSCAEGADVGVKRIEHTVNEQYRQPDKADRSK